jgi:aryl-alcohol dehydrogenase-like predicted oxidoreductase
MPAEHYAALNDKLQVVEGLTALAEKHGRSLLDLALSWLLSRVEVASVIAGATTPAQVEANAAAGDWTLDEALLDEVDSVAPAPSA